MGGDAAAAAPQAAGPTSYGRALLLDRALWSCAAALSGSFLFSLYSIDAGWIVIAGVAALAMCAAVRPSAALLVLTALAPLSTIVLLVVRADGYIRLAEALTLAFLMGWAARRAYRPRALRVSPSLRWSAALLIVLTLASGVIQQAIGATQAGASAAADLVPALFLRDYFLSRQPLVTAMLLVEGLVLMLVVADLSAGNVPGRERVLRMLTAGAAAAAAFSLLRLVTAAVQREHAWTQFLTYFATVRVNVHYPDLNAAGSYFALMLPIAVMLGTRVPAFSVVCTIMIAAGLWMTGSRAAIAATFGMALAAGILVLTRSRQRRLPVIAGLVVVALVSAATWVWYPQRTYTASSWWSLQTRVQLAKAALRMTSEHPVFGVGVGGFYGQSNVYVPAATLAALSKVRENAHNNYLQVSAELGVPGLLLFLAVLTAALGNSVRTAGTNLVTWGLLAGLAAFLVTCLAGHPLLVSLVAYPFWIAAGLAAAPAGPVAPLGRWTHRAAVALLLGLVLVTPLRVAYATSHANMEHIGVGLSQWQASPDRVRYRWAGGRSSFYVPESARRISFLLRRGPGAPAQIEVRVFLDEREADRVVLRADDGWKPVVLLPGRTVAAAFSRIDLQVCLPGTDSVIEATPSNTNGLLMVGRPTID